MGANCIDLTGQTFGRLTVLRRVENDRKKNAMWECGCSCGNTSVVRGHKLSGGHTRSCGCLRKECMRRNRTDAVTHGQSDTPTHNSWDCMIQRCTNPNTVNYHDYGGRGIVVCERWRKFENFLSDMGERPAGTSIDRIDNDKGYFASNCRWATRVEQRNNQRRAA